MMGASVGAIPRTSYRIVAGVSAVSALIVLLVIALLAWSSNAADRISRERDEEIAKTVLTQSVDRIAHAQESSTVWDDAVNGLRQRPLDFDWIDLNLGIWFWDYSGFDEVYIVDPEDAPLYAMQGGKRIDPSSFSRIRSTVLPTMQHVRTLAKSEAADSIPPGMLSVGASDIVKIEGRPAILSVKPVVSDSGEIKQQAGTEYLHLSVIFLDRGYFGQLSGLYGLADAQYRPTDYLMQGEANVALTGSGGAVVGYLAWKPLAPGRDVITTIGPALLAGVLLCFGLIAFLGTHLSRRDIDLHASRAQAEHIAFHDVLTGLPNRAQFEKSLEEMLHQESGPAKEFAILYIDLDRFKNINDTLARLIHGVGYEGLAGVA